MRDEKLKASRLDVGRGSLSPREFGFMEGAMPLLRKCLEFYSDKGYIFEHFMRF